MYFSASCRISSRRHRQSAVLVMRVPSSFLKGSGSKELEVKEAGRETAQPAPSSSTPTAAEALVVLAATVTTPAATRAASAGKTTAERIVERPWLMITKPLLPGGCDGCAAIDNNN